MRARARFAFALTILAASPSLACKCRWPTDPDLASVLQSARDGSRAIYLGKMVAPGDAVHSPTAVMEVLAGFKGTPAEGARVEIDVRSSCAWSFERDKVYLVYAGREDGNDVTICSRTREASPDDPEVTWLRTGSLPPVPTSLQRQEITCRRCSLQTEGNRLMGTPQLEQWPEVSDGRIDVALREHEPFWVGGCKEGGSCPWKAIGISANGVPFEVIGSMDSDGVACSGRLVRRWCRELERSSNETGWQVDRMRCIDPHDELSICDEPASAKVETHPREPLDRVECVWSDARRAACRLAPASAKAATRSTSRAGPVLLCRPVRTTGERMSCVVRP